MWHKIQALRKVKIQSFGNLKKKKEQVITYVLKRPGNDLRSKRFSERSSRRDPVSIDTRR